jgi:hypothetical protein
MRIFLKYFENKKADGRAEFQPKKSPKIAFSSSTRLDLPITFFLRDKLFFTINNFLPLAVFLKFEMVQSSFSIFFLFKISFKTIKISWPSNRKKKPTTIPHSK